MFDLTLACSHVQSFVCPFYISRFVRHRVDAIHSNMAVGVVCIAVNRHDVLVFTQTQRFYGVLGGSEYGTVLECSSLMFWPTQDEMVCRVFAAWVLG